MSPAPKTFEEWLDGYQEDEYDRKVIAGLGQIGEVFAFDAWIAARTALMEELLADQEMGDHEESWRENLRSGGIDGDAKGAVECLTSALDTARAQAAALRRELDAVKRKGPAPADQVTIASAIESVDWLDLSGADAMDIARHIVERLGEVKSDPKPRTLAINSPDDRAEVEAAGMDPDNVVEVGGYMAPTDMREFCGPSAQSAAWKKRAEEAEGLAEAEYDPPAESVEEACREEYSKIPAYSMGDDFENGFHIGFKRGCSGLKKHLARTRKGSLLLRAKKAEQALRDGKMRVSVERLTRAIRRSDYESGIEPEEIADCVITEMGWERE